MLVTLLVLVNTDSPVVAWWTVCKVVFGLNLTVDLGNVQFVHRMVLNKILKTVLLNSCLS